jgi:hypothetical protein
MCGWPIWMAICTIIGSKMIEATVCETNVVRQTTRLHSDTVTIQTLPDGSAWMTDWLSVSRSPDRCTACT